MEEKFGGDLEKQRTSAALGRRAVFIGNTIKAVGGPVAKAR